MAACNFDMQFIFTYVGWEGMVHDSRVLFAVLHNHDLNFSKPPEGNFFVQSLTNCSTFSQFFTLG